MKNRRAFRVALGIGCLALAACSAHPVRVTCGNHLTPINVRKPAAPISPAASSSPSLRHSDTHSVSVVARGR